MTIRKEEFSSTYSVDNFSSTTKLADNSCKSNKCIKDDCDYNPYEHRSVEHPNTTLGALIHLLKGMLGIGILAMPNAFKNAGLLFGLVGTVVLGFICTYCVYTLVSVSHKICKIARIPMLGYSETAATVFMYGPKGVRKYATAVEYFVDASLLITSLGSSVYIVFVAENLKQLFDHWFPTSHFSIYIYILFIMLPLLFLCQIRELKHLVPFSFIANVFMAISFGITLYYIFDDIPSPDQRELFPEVTALPMFLTTVIFAMEGIGIVMPLENSMAKPKQFISCPGVLITAMFIEILLYGTIGLFGYLKYGDETQASITLNLPVQELPAQLVKLLIALSVFCTFFIQMYIPMDIIWRKFFESKVKGKVRRNSVQIALRAGFVIVTVVIAVSVPNLDAIISLIGAICYSTLGLLIPAVIETVLLWDGELGVFKWRLIRNVLLGCLSLIALVTGTAESIGYMIK